MDELYDELHLEQGFTLKQSSKNCFKVYMNELLVGGVHWHGRFIADISAIETETGEVGNLYGGNLGYFETQQQALDAIVDFTKNGLLSFPTNYSFVVYQDGSMQFQFTDWKGILGKKYQTHKVALLVNKENSWQELIDEAVRDFENR